MTLVSLGSRLTALRPSYIISDGLCSDKHGTTVVTKRAASFAVFVKGFGLKNQQASHYLSIANGAQMDSCNCYIIRIRGFSLLYCGLLLMTWICLVCVTVWILKIKKHMVQRDIRILQAMHTRNASVVFVVVITAQTSPLLSVANYLFWLPAL